jgi:shikimate kinase
MKSISLIGFMGTGKSSVGRALAEKLNQPFLDLDDEIQRSEGKSIFRIFAENGERYFRTKEREILNNLSAGDLILSVGGGAFTSDDNINIINSRSRSVWLKCPIQVCIERCAKKPGERPMFSDPIEMARLYDHRAKYYKRAKYQVDSERGTPEEIADNIIEMLGLELPQPTGSD